MRLLANSAAGAPPRAASRHGARRRGTGTALALAALLAGASAAGADERRLQDLGVVVLEGRPFPSHVAAGDVNGDGQPDLALAVRTTTADAAGYGGRVLFLCRKDGRYAMPADREIELRCPPSGLLVRDFDRDGKQDFAVGLRAKRSISLYLGGENFDREHCSHNGNDSAGGGLSAGRINRGGNCDFVSGAVWRKWRGGDRFGVAYFQGPVRNDNFTSLLADMDNSGFDDIVFMTSDNQVRIYFGPFFAKGLIHSSIALEVVTLAAAFSPGAPWAELAVGDLNGDAQLDVAAGRPKTRDEPARALVFLQNSPCGFTEGAAPTLALEGAGPPLVPADFNGDGRCDLAARSADANAVLIFLCGSRNPVARSTPAPWRPDWVVRLPAPAVSMAAADLDLDGAADLAIGMHGGRLAVAYRVAPGK